MKQVIVAAPTTGTFDAAFEYVDAVPGPNKYYDYHAELMIGGMDKCFVNLESSGASGRIAYYYNDTWYYGKGNCLVV